MPRTPRTRAQAAQAAGAPPPAGPGIASPAQLEEFLSTARPRTRAPRRRAAADAPVETPDPVSLEVEAGAAPESSDEPASAPARRPRTRRPRAAATAATAAAPAEAEAEAEVASETTVVAEEVAGVEAEAELPAAAEVPAAAEAPQEQETVTPEPAPSPPALDSWSIARPYEIGPDGKVRYLDTVVAAPVVAEPEPQVAEEDPAVELEPAADASELVAEEQDVTAEAQEAPTVEEAVAPPRRGRRRGRGGRDAGEETAATAEEVVIEAGAADTVIDEAPVTLEEAEAAIVEGDLEEAESAAAESEDGQAVDEDGVPRRRRRSRRGGRGRHRPSAAVESVNGIVDEETEITELGVVEAEAEQPFVPASAPVPSPSRQADNGRSGRGLLEDLMARQNVLLDQMMQRQTAMMRTMEQALTVLNSTLRGSDLTRVTAMPRLGVFVDVPNIMYAAERYNVKVDFGKLLEYVSRDRTLIRASAYAPISDDPGQRLESQRFVEPFINHGYRIVTKPLKRFADGSIKANFDIELAMDILTMSERLDIVSLVSGDGDFRRLVDIVASKGVRVEVVAFSQSTASELRAIADSYVDLTAHLKDLCVPAEPELRPRGGSRYRTDDRAANLA